MTLKAYHESTETKNTQIQDLYICAGNRTYMVGSQNGGFPDFGHHVKDEMGGLWNHPIKLMDGFWLQITDAGAPQAAETGVWLKESDSFHNYAFYNEHHYSLPELGLEVVRRQFCPDDIEGFIIRYELRNLKGNDRELSLRFLGRTDLSPVWFSEHKQIVDGRDEARLDDAYARVVAWDVSNPWFVTFGADRPYTNGVVERDLFGPERTAGEGITGDLTYEGVTVPANGTAEINFFVAGSYTSEALVLETYDIIKQKHMSLWESKYQRYEGMTTRTILDIPDLELQKVFNWVKFHNDWLVREVPEIGRALGAGHPEYPWWFGCDNSYAVLGLLPLGDLRLAKETLDLILRQSEQENGNGRIIHEISTCDAVANKGNTQETAHFIKCLWDAFLWNGDIEFLRSAYPSVKKGLTWLLGEMDPDGDLLPEGYGIIEIEGLNVELIDSAVYTYEALRAAAKIAELFGEREASLEYADLALRLGKKINSDMWIEDEGLYADAMAEVGKVMQRMDLYIERARNSGAEAAAQDLEKMKDAMSELDPKSEQPWLFKNWVINTPMEVGLAPRDKAIRALDRMGTPEFTGPWGTYLSGTYRTQMMTISTGVQAVAEAQYDRMDESLRFVKLIASTFNKRLPGSISEMSPDYGCFVQAWTNYGIVWPLMTYMLGIQPRAYWNELTIRPRLPQAWKHAAVEQVHLGLNETANILKLGIKLSETEDVYQIALDVVGWTVKLDLGNASNARILLDGIEASANQILSNHDGSVVLEIVGAGSHEIRVQR
jgi:glycogen debranching enzyme